MKKLEEIKSITNLQVIDEAIDGIRGQYYDSLSSRWLTYVFSWGGGWEHLSVSTPNKIPTWEQMCRMKDIFWNDDEVCIEYHPKKSEYVNNHSYCLHIWKPIDKEIPTPPTEFVGIRGINLV